VEGAQHTPKFKAKVWDGKIRLYSLAKRVIYAGLVSKVVDFCNTFGYEVEFKGSPVYGLPNQTTNIHPEDVVSYVKSLDLHARGEPIEMRDYQYSAVYQALKNKRLTILSPTASGKSSIIYAVTRYLVDNFDYRVLIIVPTISLVTQMFKDFEDYSSHNGFNVEENTAIVMAGYEKVSKKNIVISTYQSLAKLESPYFNSYDAIMIDECVHPTTKITTPDGYKLIKDIVAGDTVVTLNEKTLKNETKKVVSVFKNISPHEELYKVWVSPSNFLLLTGNHKVLTSKGWKRADQLKLEDKIQNI
jgi:hypothetical protein